jgi:site-specific recombinase
MSDLRRRNGVVVFSDHMNAYHAQMEHVLIDGPAQLATPQGAMALLAQVGALDYLAARLRSEAPAALLANPDFVALQQQVQASVAAVRDALVRQDPAAAKAAMDKVKKPYSQMFLKFG